jgi:hypothetical protein
MSIPPSSGWTVAIEVPKDVIDGPLHRAYQLALGIGMAVLALSLVLAWWMARAIRRPVAALTTGGGQRWASRPVSRRSAGD